MSCALAFLLASPLLADPVDVGSVLFSNLGSGNTFISNREYDSPSTFLLTPFAATAGGNLGRILTPVFCLHSPVTFGLYSNDPLGASREPGTWRVGVFPLLGVPVVLTPLTSALNPMLTADMKYWFGITQTQRFQVAWYENNQNVPGGIWEAFSAGGIDELLEFVPDSPMPAIKLFASSAPCPSVPEPTSVLLLAVGIPLVALLAHARKT